MGSVISMKNIVNFNCEQCGIKQTYVAKRIPEFKPRRFCKSCIYARNRAIPRTNKLHKKVLSINKLPDIKCKTMLWDQEGQGHPL